MGYGSTIDYFGIADTNVKLQTSDLASAFNVDASVQDSVGDFACRTKSDTENTVTCVYSVIGGGDANNSHNLDTYAEVGEVKTFDTNTHYQVTGVEVNTVNTAFPTITLTGVKDPGTTAQTHALYSSGISFIALKKAQGFGIVPTGAAKVTAGSVSISGNAVTAQDSLGVTVKREPEAVRAVTNNTLQICTGTAAAAADTANSWAFEDPASSGQVNNEYGTTTVSTFKDIARD